MWTLKVSLLLIVLMFFSKAIGFDLKCTFSKYGICHVADLVITSEDDAISSIEPLFDYDTLIIRNQIVNFVPENIARFFPNLQHLEISNSSLEWITQENIKELTKLRTLKLEGNKLEILEEDLFKFNTQLKTINIRKNQLKFVHKNVLFNLRYIYMEQNTCTPHMYRDVILTNVERSQFLNSFCQSWENAFMIYKRYFNKRNWDLQSKIDEQTHRLEASDGNLDAANKRNRDLQSTIDEQTQRLEASDGNLDAANKRNRDLQSTIDEQTQRLEASDGNLDAANKRNRDLQSTIDEQTQRLEASDGNLDAANKRNRDLQSTTDQLTRRLEASDGNLDDANKRNRDLQSTIDEQTHRLEASDGNLDAALTNYRQQKLINLNVGSTEELIDSQLIDIYCSYGMCLAIDFKFPFANLSIGSEHCENYKSQDITSINIHQQQTLFLPNNLAEPFPLLNQLSVIESGLCEIDNRGFGGLDLITLNLTRNKIPEIPVDTFADLANLQELDLSFNRLQTLYGNVFSNLKSLRTLRLNNNLLTSINLDIPKPWESLTGLFLQQNRLKFISAYLLVPLTNLTLLDLSNNVCIDLIHPESTLMDIEATIIDNCTAPVELYCKMFENESTENIARDCQVENLFIEYPKTKITKLNGVGPYDTIKTLFLYKQSIKFFPLELSHHLPNIQRIEIQQSELTSLHRTDFYGFFKLLEIVINGNNLSSSISEGAFDTVPQLESLDLSSNNIVSLPMNIFAKLTRVHTLLLSKNQIVRLEANILPGKNSIETFFMDNNHLEFIETKTIRLLRKAKLIDLTENVCIDMKYDKYGNKTRPLTELSGEIDINCSTGRTEPVQPTEEEFFVQKKSLLQRIEIQQSNLTSLHRAAFVGFSKLLEIVINGNNLSSSISEGAFDTVTQLELLDLASNNIVSLPMNIFSKLTRLHTLLLSKNQIVSFAANMLPRKNSIETFRVDNNQLEFIETKTILFLRKAKLIDLTENVCIDMEYVRSENSTRALIDLSSEIDLNCSIDD